MFADSLYEFDRRNESHTARIASGGYLYRLTSLAHSTAQDILSGGGTLNNPVPGRFNSPHQRTSYCANNVLICIAEVLYHMYRTALQRIESEAPARAIRSSVKDERCLAIVRVT